MALQINDVAKVCHEANRAYCEAVGDATQLPWEQAAQWQRDSAVAGVRWRLDNPDAPTAAQHEAWMADKVRDGWTYGPEKDAAAKRHPCIVPYGQLPEFQHAKDALFVAVVAALKPVMALPGRAIN